MEGSVKGIKWIDGQSESKRMTRTQKETPLSLSELIDAFQPEAYRYSVMLMGNREDAWDLMQETWILVYQKLPGLKNPDCFKSWFYQILTRNSWKMKRKTSREVPVENIFDSYEPGQEKSSEDKMIQSERNLLLMEQIQKLNPKLREVVLLYYYHEFSVGEIAKITGSITATVKSRLFQARKQLKQALEEDENSWR